LSGLGLLAYLTKDVDSFFCATVATQSLNLISNDINKVKGFKFKVAEALSLNKA
jgi:hypothetical protein